MADYIYQAKNSQGQLIDGKITASNEEQATTLLQGKGLFVLSIDLQKRGLFSEDIFQMLKGPSKSDTVVFTRQLSTLVEADVPLVSGLEILSNQTAKAGFRKVIDEVARAIEGGSTLSVALNEHPAVFSPFYINLVRAGEVSGQLQKTLLYLADYLERSASLNSKIKGALAYPAFVLFALLVISIIMVTTVLPQLLTIIKEAGVEELPLSTRVLISVTDFVQTSGPFLAVILLAGIISGVIYLRTEAGKKNLDALIIAVPTLGRVAQNLYIARFAETFSTLIRAGVPILESLTVTADVIGNSVYRDIVLSARENVQNGGNISETFALYPQMPPLVTSMMEIGERTGKTDQILSNILSFYKNEAERDVSNLSQLIEPVLILILGVAVGVLVSAILLPIYSIVGAAG